MATQSQQHSDLQKLAFAYEFAAKKHRNQRRKDAEKTPYVNHPINVVNWLTQAGVVDVDVLIAGVLHDTIEDTGTSPEEIKTLFGSRVCDIVLECSDDKKLPKEKRKQVQIEHAKAASTGAKLVKLADKYSNIQDLLSNPPAKWSTAEVHGYGVWCYAVFLELKGVNAYFDKLFGELFSKYGYDKYTKEQLLAELTKYYGNIKNSE